MTTITLKLKTKREATQIFDFAKKSNIDMTIIKKIKELNKPVVKKPVYTTKEKNKMIMEMSKAVNKSMHEKYI
jgi:phosphoribosylamine-glycine ligase